MAKPGASLQSSSRGNSELMGRILFVLGALVVFRLGSFVPIPGIDPAVLAQLFEQQKGTMIEMLNMFSGGALEQCVSLLWELCRIFRHRLLFKLHLTQYLHSRNLRKKVHQAQES